MSISLFNLSKGDTCTVKLMTFQTFVYLDFFLNITNASNNNNIAKVL